MTRIRNRTLFTSESVTEGHPDKLADQISDAILDAIYEKDPQGRVACETLVTTGLVFVAGEITTSCYVEVPKLVRGVIRDAGYTDLESGFNYKTCGVITAIQEQSPDIALGVDTGGAGDQGMMFGYATNETLEYMPLPILLAHRLARRLAEVRKNKTLTYLRPDGKSQVTVEYLDGKPVKVTGIVIGAHHSHRVSTPKLRRDIREVVIEPIIPKEFMNRQTRIFINATGRFEIGGPMADTGVTGRKIMVDTYGGLGRHGGGAFCVAGDALINTERGLIRLKDSKRDVEKGTLVKTDVHPRMAAEWYDNGIQPTIKVRTSNGYQLEGTWNQRIRVIDPQGRYVWRRLDGLKRGDVVAIQRFGRMFGQRVDTSEFRFQHLPATRRKRNFSFPRELTQDYTYLMGLMTGDGNCMRRDGVILCTPKADQRRNVQSLFKRISGSPGVPAGHWTFLGGKELREYLRFLGLDHRRCWQKRVPWSVFQAPRSVTAAFLRGLFDTDGHITVSGRNGTTPKIGLSSTSLPLIQEVQQLLLHFGIISHIERIDNRHRIFQISPGRMAKSRHLLYQLEIRGFVSRRLFRDEISFALPRKRKLLERFRWDGVQETETIPHQRERIQRLWARLPEELRYKDECKMARFMRRVSWKSTKELTYRKLDQFVEAYRGFLGRLRDFQALDFFKKTRLFFDRVAQLERSVAHTYDLLVPEGHTFIANGFACHNSGKDPTKVDRSASYMARHIAKNIVAAKLAEKVELQLAYVIGVREPVSLMVNTFQTGKVPDEKIRQAILKLFDLTPAGIIRDLKLRRPLYRKTAVYGHFGRNENGFTWEELDKVDALRKEVFRQSRGKRPALRRPSDRPVLYPVSLSRPSLLSLRQTQGT